MNLLDRGSERRNRVGCHAPHLGGVRNVFGSVLWCQAAKEEEEDQHRAANDDELAHGGASLAHLSPVAAGLASVALERLSTELVVDHTTEGDAVTKELQTADLGAPDEHGGDNEEDILEHTAEREDQGGSLANL